MTNRAVWLSLLASALVHLLLVVLAEPFWRDVDDAEAFRVRFAYRPRFEPRRLGAMRPRPAPASQMERLRTEAIPADAPEAEPPVDPTAIPARTPEPVATITPPPGVRPDTLVLAHEVMPSPVDYGWHDLESRDTALDLLRIEDLARADAYRAAIIPSPNGPRDTRGYINFTRLNLYGTGSGRLGELEALARYMRDYTGILAQVRPNQHRHFLSERLLEDPVHFLFQNGGMPGWTDHMLTNFNEKERSLLGSYLREGGFLVIESDPASNTSRRYDQEMIELLCGVMGGEGRLSPLPASHPINHSYYHREGFQERFYDVWEGLDLCSANLEGYTYAAGPYGALLDDQLVAIIGGAYHSNWRGDDVPVDASAEADSGSVTTPSLMRGVNIVSYVLHRENGPVVRRELPAWEVARPSVALSKYPEDVETAPWMDADVLDMLDASLAIVHVPLGEPIRSGLRLRFDDRYDVDMSGGTNALLVHNLEAGVHQLELQYRGESRRFEVSLVPDRVTTFTFSLKDFVVFKRLALKERQERVHPALWRESFEDLAIDEHFSRDNTP